jgi:hypothetical protein
MGNSLLRKLEVCKFLDENKIKISRENVDWIIKHYSPNDGYSSEDAMCRCLKSLMFDKIEDPCKKDIIKVGKEFFRKTPVNATTEGTKKYFFKYCHNIEFIRDVFEIPLVWQKKSLFIMLIGTDYMNDVKLRFDLPCVIATVGKFKKRKIYNPVYS